MQRNEVIRKFGLALPGLDKPITMQALNEDTERRILASRRLGEIESDIRYKKISFERESGMKAEYVMMDEETHIEMMMLDKWANPHREVPTSIEIRLGYIHVFDGMKIVIVSGRGRGIQIGC